MVNFTGKIYFVILCLSILANALLVSKTQEPSYTLLLREVFKAGDTKKLALVLGEEIQINTEQQKGRLTKAEALSFFKAFFEKNPPKDFEYVHSGKTDEKLNYTIARYVAKENTYTLYLLIRKGIGGKAVVETIDINLE